ncbi:unnamed protein product [Amoebophrya sp. A120]|nr:unnamed protein product [Amoebophrya sp. A120]|eukprot:GSA120T00008379001.1
MVLFKDMLPGTRIFVDYFGKVKKARTLMQDVSSYERADSSSASDENGKKDTSNIKNNPSNINNKPMYTEVQLPADDPPVYLLSHFHSDHYMGMEKHWESPVCNASTGVNARIYCTHTSGKLLEMLFNLRPGLVCGKPYSQPFFDVRKRYVICFVDANHCPGSAVVLILVLKSKKKYMNTGDFRYYPEIEEKCDRAWKDMVEFGLQHGVLDLWEDKISAMPTNENNADGAGPRPRPSPTSPSLSEMERTAAAKQMLLEKQVEILLMDFSWADDSFDRLPDKPTSVDRLLSLVEKYYYGTSTASATAAAISTPTPDGFSTSSNLLLADPNRRKKTKIFLHSYGLGDEELLLGVFNRFKQETFLFADERRWLELRVCGALESEDLRRRCLNYSTSHPNLQQVRFFIVKNSAQRKRVFREVQQRSAGASYLEGLQQPASRGPTTTTLSSAKSVPQDNVDIIKKSSAYNHAVGRTKAVEEVELTKDFVEISCTTMWWCYNKHLLIQLGACADVCPAVVDEQGIWRVLWAMHSPLRELRLFAKYVKPRYLKPVCAVIQAGHYEVTEQDKTNAQKCFQGLFGDFCEEVLPEGEENCSQINVDEALALTEISKDATGGAVAPRRREILTDQQVEVDSAASSQAQNDGADAQLLSKRPRPVEVVVKKRPSLGSPLDSKKALEYEQQQDENKKKRKIRATGKNVVHEQDGSSLFFGIKSGVEFSPENERRHAIDVFHRGNKNTIIQLNAADEEKRRLNFEKHGNLCAKTYEQRKREEEQKAAGQLGGSNMDEGKNNLPDGTTHLDVATSSKPPGSGAPVLLASSSSSTAGTSKDMKSNKAPPNSSTSHHYESAFAKVAAPLQKNNAASLAELRARAEKDKSTKRGRALLSNFFRLRGEQQEMHDGVEVEQQPGATPNLAGNIKNPINVKTFHNGNRFDPTLKGDNIQIDHAANKKALAVLNEKYYKRKKFKYASDQPLDVAELRKSEYRAKLRGQGFTDEEIERKMNQDIGEEEDREVERILRAGGGKVDDRNLFDPSSLEPDSGNSDLLKQGLSGQLPIPQGRDDFNIFGTDLSRGTDGIVGDLLAEIKAQVGHDEGLFYNSGERGKEKFFAAKEEKNKDRAVADNMKIMLAGQGEHQQDSDVEMKHEQDHGFDDKVEERNKGQSERTAGAAFLPEPAVLRLENNDFHPPAASHLSGAAVDASAKTTNQNQSQHNRKVDQNFSQGNATLTESLPLSVATGKTETLPESVVEDLSSGQQGTAGGHGQPHPRVVQALAQQELPDARFPTVIEILDEEEDGVNHKMENEHHVAVEKMPASSATATSAVFFSPKAISTPAKSLHPEKFDAAPPAAEGAVGKVVAAESNTDGAVLPVDEDQKTAAPVLVVEPRRRTSTSGKIMKKDPPASSVVLSAKKQRKKDRKLPFAHLGKKDLCSAASSRPPKAANAKMATTQAIKAKSKSCGENNYADTKIHHALRSGITTSQKAEPYSQVGVLVKASAAQTKVVVPPRRALPPGFNGNIQNGDEREEDNEVVNFLVDHGVSKERDATAGKSSTCSTTSCIPVCSAARGPPSRNAAAGGPVPTNAENKHQSKRNEILESSSVAVEPKEQGRGSTRLPIFPPDQRQKNPPPPVISYSPRDRHEPIQLTKKPKASSPNLWDELSLFPPSSQSCDLSQDHGRSSEVISPGKMLFGDSQESLLPGQKNDFVIGAGAGRQPRDQLQQAPQQAVLVPSTTEENEKKDRFFSGVASAIMSTSAAAKALPKTKFTLKVPHRSRSGPSAKLLIGTTFSSSTGGTSSCHAAEQEQNQKQDNKKEARHREADGTEKEQTAPTRKKPKNVLVIPKRK